MPSVVSVTLNQPSNIDTQDVQVERFAALYESESSSGKDAPFQDVALPSVKKSEASQPRLDLTTTAENGGTRVTAELAKTVTDASGNSQVVSKEVSVLLPDIEAYAATKGLAEVLEGSSKLKTDPVTDDALANRLYSDLLTLLEGLGDLFDDLDLVLFPPLPDDVDLPDLGQFTFTDPYYERLMQLTWSSWSGQRPYDADMMFELGLRSSSVSALALDFNRRVVESVVPDDPSK